MNNSLEFFIETIRKHPLLWNSDHIGFRDAVRKDYTWDRIAITCGLSNGKEAKAQWKKLKDSHREALRRRNPCYGPAAANMKPWKYERMMEFLLPQSEERENTTMELDDSLTEAFHDDTPEPENSVCPGTSEKPKKSTVNAASLLKERRREEKRQNWNEIRNQSFDMNRLPQDALFNLFTSLYMKTRDLPKPLQLRVQREVFDVVSRAEEEALNGDQSSMSPPTIYVCNSSQDSPVTESGRFSEEIKIEPE